METTEIFTMALGLGGPWQIREVQFVKGDDGKKRLYIDITFECGYRSFRRQMEAASRRMTL